MVFLVLKTLWYVKKSDTVKGGQVALFMGPGYVVTVRQGAPFELESVRHHLEEHPDVLKQGPAAGVHAVCDRVVDLYELVVSDLETDVDMSRIGVQQNDDMRRMSAWAAIFAVITVLAGIYGMNFARMPELRWSFGYPLVLLVMAGLSVALDRMFKKSGWL